MAWLAVTVVASLAPPPELRFPLYLGTVMLPALAAGSLAASLVGSRERAPLGTVSGIGVLLVTLLFILTPEHETLVAWIMWAAAAGLPPFVGGRLSKRLGQ